MALDGRAPSHLPPSAQDKERNLTEELRGVLRRITDEVIGKRRARSFLLSRELAAHPVIHKLFDLRVLHLVQRGYADKDRPGVRYNIYTLDYGTYVDLMNTSRKPEVGFESLDGDQPDYVVPFDDKRSIRRIILTADILNAAPERQFWSAFQLVELDQDAGERSGVIRADLEGRGERIGAYDVLIAGIALARGHILATHNVREFGRVAGLQIEDWAAIP